MKEKKTISCGSGLELTVVSASDAPEPSSAFGPRPSDREEDIFEGLPPLLKREESLLATLPPVAKRLPAPPQPTVALSLSSIEELERPEVAKSSRDLDFRNVKVENFRPCDKPNRLYNDDVKEIQITFNRAVNPLGTQAYATGGGDEQEVKPWWVPSIEPEIEGSWYWADPTILKFAPRGECLPRATTYRLQAHDGTSWTLTTSSPEFEIPKFYHEAGLQPLLNVETDQRVDWQAVADYVVLFDEDENEIEVEFVSSESSWREVGVFRPLVCLREDARYECFIEQGAPSIEGPNVSLSDSKSEFFQTYGKLELMDVEAKAAEHRLPGILEKVIRWTINLQFSCQLDSKAHEDLELVVEPALENARTYTSSKMMVFSGNSAGGPVGFSVRGVIRDRYGRSQEIDEYLELELRRPPVFLSYTRPLVSLPNFKKKLLTYHYSSQSALFVRIHRVESSEWQDFVQFYYEGRGSSNNLTHRDFKSEGTTQFHWLANDGHPQTFDLDLSPFVKKFGGHLVVQARLAHEDEIACVQRGRNLNADEIRRNWRYEVWPRGEAPERPWTQTVWVQSTDLAPGLLWDHNRYSHTVLDLLNNKLIASVKNRRIEKPENFEHACSYLHFTEGRREAIIPFLGAKAATSNDVPLSYCFSDRKLYRPGERMVVKGWLWRESQDQDIQDLAGQEVVVKLLDGDWNRFHVQKVRLSKHSSFHLDLTVPESIKLGNGRAEVMWGDRGHYLGLDLRFEEYRKPTFEVQVTKPEKDKENNVTHWLVDAKSFAGTPMPGARVRIQVKTSTSDFSPPGWSDFQFGEGHQLWQKAQRNPWTPVHREPMLCISYYFWDSSRQYHLQTELDQNGQAVLEFAREHEGLSPKVSLSVTVEDAQKQEVVKEYKGHPFAPEFYIGLSVERSVLFSDDLEVEWVVVDQVGRLVEKVLVEIRIEGQESHFLESTLKPQTLTLHVAKQGSLRLRGQARDETGRASFAELELYRTGDQGVVPPDEFLYCRSHSRLSAGEDAKVLLQVPSDGVVTTRVWNGRTLQAQHHQLQKGRKTLSLPLTDQMIGHSALHLDFVGRDETGNVQTFRSCHTLQVESEHHHLRVELTVPDEELSPGQTVEIEARVTDWFDQPVGDVEVALCVVDEAVLQAAAYKIPTPFEKLFPARKSPLTGVQLFSDFGISDVERLAKELSYTGQMMAASMMAPPKEPTHAFRRQFHPLAHFEPDLVTDEAGVVRARFQLPHGLTKWNVTAVVVTKTRRYGYAEECLFVQQSVYLEPHLPRFLHIGDVVQVPVVVRASGTADSAFQLGLRGMGFEVLGSAAFQGMLTCGRPQRVVYTVRATDAAKALFQFRLKLSDRQDAVEVSIPIYRGCPASTQATCDELVNEVCSVPVHWPEAALPGFGGLRVSVSTTALHSLNGGLKALALYEPRNTQQLAHKVAAAASVQEYLRAFQDPELEALINLQRWSSDLLKLRTYNGFPFLKSERPEWDTSLILTNLEALRSLDLAGRAGADLGDFWEERALGWLPPHRGLVPNGWGGVYDARVLELRLRWGGTDSADKLLSFTPKSFRAWLWYLRYAIEPEKVDRGIKLIEDAVIQTAQTASVRLGPLPFCLYYYESTVTINALALRALLVQRPSHPLVPKLARGLQAHRVQGQWRNMVENFYAVEVLGDYFRTRESEEPGLVAGAWCDELQLLGRTFRGRDHHRYEVELSSHNMPQRSDVVVSSSGKGRLYHRVELQWAQDCLAAEAVSRGFHLEKTLEVVEGKADLSKWAEGSCSVEHGTILRVWLRFSSPAPRYHVSLVDPLPAGFEIVRGGSWMEIFTKDQLACSAFNRQLRDHQFEFYTTLMVGNRWQVHYEIKATTCGEFLMPGARIEESYSPDVYARTKGAVATVS